MAINKKLIHFNTFDNFNSLKLSANKENTEYTDGVDGSVMTGNPDILYQSIVFIKDTKQIWTHGTIYSSTVTTLKDNQILYFSDEQVVIKDWAKGTTPGGSDMDYNPTEYVLSHEYNSKEKYGIVTLSDNRVPNGLFISLPSITKIVMADNIESIGLESFEDCANLEEIHISNNLVSMGYAAFYLDKSLKEIYLPDTFTTWDSSCQFMSCSSLSNVRLSSNLTTLSGNLFNGCALSSITIPESITAFDGYGVFYGCTALTSIVIPKNLTTFNGEGTFYGCTSLHTVTFKSTTLEELPNQTFRDCSNLSKLIIPECEQNIMVGAFHNAVIDTLVINGSSITFINTGSSLSVKNFDYSGPSIQYFNLNNSYLETLTLRNEAVVTYLDSIIKTPTSKLRIYVPATLIETYKTTYSTLSSYFFAITGDSILTEKKLEDILNGDINIGGDLYVNGQAEIGGGKLLLNGADLQVTETVLTNNLRVDGTAGFNNDVSVDGDLNVTGECNFSTVFGNGAEVNYLTVTGDANLNEVSILDVTVDKNLNVDGDTTLNKDLTVTGDANLNEVSILDVTVDKNLNVDGDTTLNKDLTVGGDTTLEGDLLINGETTLGYVWAETVEVDSILHCYNDAYTKYCPDPDDESDTIANTAFVQSAINHKLSNINIEDLVTYGVEWDVTVADPHVTRIGNMSLHRTLPIQSLLKGCIAQGNKIMYYLNENNWRFRQEPWIVSGEFQDSTTFNLTEDLGFDMLPSANKLYIKAGNAIGYITEYQPSDTLPQIARITWEGGTAPEDFENITEVEIGSRLDGYDGTVRVHCPAFYIKSESEGNKRRVRISQIKIDDSWTYQPEILIDAYRSTTLSTVPESMGYLSTLPEGSAISVNNKAEYCIGGDLGVYGESLGLGKDLCLGKPRTNISLANARIAARLANSEVLSYNQYKNIFYWLYVIEYANFNCQELYNETLTSEGYHQGGVGSGLFGADALGCYELGFPPMTECGFLDEYGNNTIAIIFSDNVAYQRWRCFDSPFGDVATMLEGIIITRVSGDLYTLYIYTTDNPENFDDSFENKTLLKTVLLLSTEFYIKEFNLGKSADIIPESILDNAQCYKCDLFLYHATAPDQLGKALIIVVGGKTYDFDAGLSFIEIIPSYVFMEYQGFRTVSLV